MANIDNSTLLVSLQSVYESINRYEALLESDTLKDPENVEEILMMYDEAFKVLKSAYLEAQSTDPRLPLMEEIIKGA
ncbi:MAG: hypothetical protein VX447_00270 [Pseudomonadota bacterium]|uniref:Uncharacterized protein n=1 Tax=Gallaecimonas pentaromativorans TaxID=584787 RepID=A0A3N1PUE5_9GAMM|nr:hypothetical protein [Gallaecimonas pentaromativorans]MED5523176.1 hypothetical protein [Pseudomonadota bacterium]ROQ30370.1 hypothetical protein EDC28_10156 [Gallaecimonas pentaromativorans]